MGATKEMVITKFDYKNDEGFYTMFEYENQIAIEYNGYDVSLMDVDPSEAIILSEETINVPDYEEYIDNHFKNV